MIHQRAQKASQEGRISLAMVAYKNNPLQSKRSLAEAYGVPESTLRTRLRGVQPKHETVSVNRNLSSVQEQSLIQWILDLDRRGFPPPGDRRTTNGRRASLCSRPTAPSSASRQEMGVTLCQELTTAPDEVE